jgi:SET domain-containing protein
VDGHYQIGIYTVRPIAEGEEITFDYNSVTEVIAISSFCISSNVNCFIL